jgi:hypothetical protein
MLAHLNTPWISHVNPNILWVLYFGVRQQARDSGSARDAALDYERFHEKVRGRATDSA